MQQGGKLIDQGKYGCVFNPPLLCESDVVVKGNQVGKVTQRADSKNEITASEVLGTIPHWSKYFLLPNSKSLCKLKPVEKQKDRNIYKCDIVQEYDLENTVQFDMPFGGKSLYERIKKAQLNPSAFSFFDFVQHILEGASEMLLKGFVHFDMHEGNILMDDTLTPKIIDFGESFLSRNISNEVVDARWKVYTPNFSPEPPEVTIMTGIRKGKTMEECLNEVLYQKDALKFAKQLSGISFKDQASEFRNFWGTSRAALEKNWVGIWKAYWPMFDSWSFGSIFIDMVNRFIRDGVLQKMKGYNTRSEPLQKALRHMLRMSPRDRYDCIEVLNIYDPKNKLLQSKAVKQWLLTRKSQRETTAAHPAVG